MGLTRLHAYAPLSSPVGLLHAFVLSCVVIVLLKGKVCFVCALQLTIHILYVSSILFYHTYKAILHAFFFLLFLAIGYTIIYTILLLQHLCNLEERGSRSNENSTAFRFSFYSQLFKTA